MAEKQLHKYVAKKLRHWHPSTLLYSQHHDQDSVLLYEGRM